MDAADKERFAESGKELDAHEKNCFVETLSQFNGVERAVWYMRLSFEVLNAWMVS